MFKKSHGGWEHENRGHTREVQPWRRGRAWVLGTPVASKAEASSSSSGTRLAASPSFKPSLSADLAFHLNLASTRKSPGTQSAGSGDSTMPLATTVGESWAGWFYSHSQGLPETVGSTWWEVAWRSKVGCHGFVASFLCLREDRAYTLPTPPSLVYGKVANAVGFQTQTSS
jgi:hypothetical protein